MTYPEIERAAAEGAVVLWALGVIEQHGPHLPLATDVYIPSAILRLARADLARRGIPSVIAPAFYWGVNHVTGRFPGSFEVRPEVMIEVLKDAFQSFVKDGFKRVFCLSGHGDALHNKTIFAAVGQGSAAGKIDVRMIASPALATRLGIDLADPRLALSPPPPSSPAPVHLDIHAGQWETSLLLSICPDTVRSELLSQLEPTKLGAPDLAEWRKGQEVAKRITPHGYFGDPAKAEAARGAELLRVEATAVADAVATAIAGAIGRKP
jgi:creatinine amidohydrolase